MALKIILGVLAAIVAFMVLGFVIHLLFIVAIVLLVVWLLGFLVSRSHPTRRWFNW
ncbi:MAG: hydrophobic protein [Actinomycetota bacterium]